MELLFKILLWMVLGLFAYLIIPLFISVFWYAITDDIPMIISDLWYKLSGEEKRDQQKFYKIIQDHTKAYIDKTLQEANTNNETNPKTDRS